MPQQLTKFVFEAACNAEMYRHQSASRKQPLRRGRIHVDDLAALCLSLIGTVRALSCDVDAVGAIECTIAVYVQTLSIACVHPRAALVRSPAGRVAHLRR